MTRGDEISNSLGDDGLVFVCGGHGQWAGTWRCPRAGPWPEILSELNGRCDGERKVLSEFLAEVFTFQCKNKINYFVITGLFEER